MLADILILIVLMVLMVISSRRFFKKVKEHGGEYAGFRLEGFKPKGTWQDKDGVWRYAKPDDVEERGDR